MKNRYIIIRDQSAKKVGETRNVIYDALEKITIYKKKTKNKDERYWHSHEQALAAAKKLESGELSAVHNAKYGFYHL